MKSDNLNHQIHLKIESRRFGSHLNLHGLISNYPGLTAKTIKNIYLYTVNAKRGHFAAPLTSAAA